MALVGGAVLWWSECVVARRAHSLSGVGFDAFGLGPPSDTGAPITLGLSLIHISEPTRPY